MRRPLASVDGRAMLTSANHGELIKPRITVHAASMLLHQMSGTICQNTCVLIVSDIAIFVLKRDVKLQLTCVLMTLAVWPIRSPAETFLVCTDLLVRGDYENVRLNGAL